MVDPRHGNDPPQNGSHPRQPNVGGPAPDRPPAGPGDPRRRHRLWTGVAIVAAIVVILIGGLFAAPYFNVLDGETTTAQPAEPAAPAAAPADTAATPQPQPGDCRDFEKTVQIAGETRTVAGRACMQQDGSWQVVD